MNVFKECAELISNFDNSGISIRSYHNFNNYEGYISIYLCGIFGDFVKTLYIYNKLKFLKCHSVR